jgi:hypothetical protein
MELIHSTDDILAVARRLLARGILFYRYEFHSADFGSWIVVAGIERDSYQFRWEGRTITLTISQCVVVNEWREWQPIHALNLQHPEAVSMIEIFLRERFPG